ncbi:hypothetical protein E3P92_02225 [Wallemia ichthyophaga]|uniref:Pyrroline-5-carboxylate reductase n=2 Tax=Wallemia ichthyophaga TaxID=245174 RepID=A0A4T0G889_WALIC|nr:Pyrroline-5-carboxylate reductase [Wallemia ichthyophaga EXF-994]TIA72532.1 hypothetical protein E3P91_01976 [Wallemia ichthyophaga]EOR03647.1 Pyrroline-5-carboxylate reductase [Wallemia ichthyophaga EXF-994]TIA97522.1 hypothetical protein E3P95_02821 [Wallemia ichthyophaga]TIA98647.1 hypothetical protein E3P94_02873 [Wallemia ichthyophaga]TIB13703.1 hypothetical protein E3P92_02225 [Wallemia ichthyophaga]
MGVAVLSGVIDGLNTRNSMSTSQLNTDDASGTSTPIDISSSQAIMEAKESCLPSKFLCTVNRSESAKSLRKTFDLLGDAGKQVNILQGGGVNVDAVRDSDVVLLCAKPQMAHTILNEPGMQEALANKLLISILAGVTITQIHSWVPKSTKVVRAMPNTPCKIREGMTVVSALPTDWVFEKELILAIFRSIGRCRFLEEKHFDACTALCGSGPAFAVTVLEAMADGGVMMGLPRAEAVELAAQSMQGIARMVLETGVHPAALKDSVTTPGGCTIAGLLALEDGKVRSTMARTIQVATSHASGLGQAKK